MVRGSKILAGALATVMLGVFTSQAHAVASLSILGDTGTLRVTTYAPILQVASAPLTNPYGTPPAPTITPITNGWKIDFVPTAEFFASANNNGGGKTTEMAGKLDFIFTNTTKFAATVNVYENGIWSTIGNGIVKANGPGSSGGVIVSEWDGQYFPSQTFGNGFAPAAFLGSGVWTQAAQVSGFGANQYFSYRISIDNDLLAESLVGPPNNSSASIAKKNFSIIITTDGSTGGGPPIPEPASLGVLALGGLALLARRRK